MCLCVELLVRCHCWLVSLYSCCCCLSDINLPFARWDTDRVALWLHVLGLSMYIGNCRRWIRNGEQLLMASSRDLEKVRGWTFVITLNIEVVNVVLERPKGSLMYHVKMTDILAYILYYSMDNYRDRQFCVTLMQWHLIDVTVQWYYLSLYEEQ